MIGDDRLGHLPALRGGQPVAGGTLRSAAGIAGLLEESTGEAGVGDQAIDDLSSDGGQYGAGTMGLVMLELAKRTGAASVDVVEPGALRAFGRARQVIHRYPIR